MTRLEKCTIGVLTVSLGWLVTVILCSIILHITREEDRPTCVDPSGHFERECP